MPMTRAALRRRLARHGPLVWPWCPTRYRVEWTAAPGTGVHFHSDGWPTAERAQRRALWLLGQRGVIAAVVRDLRTRLVWVAGPAAAAAAWKGRIGPERIGPAPPTPPAPPPRPEDDTPNPWGIRLTAMFSMSEDSHMFLARTDLESAIPCAVCGADRTDVPRTSMRNLRRGLYGRYGRYDRLCCSPEAGR